MATLESIETKIKRLQEQAAAIKAKHASSSLERIVALMDKSGVTIADIEAHLSGAKRGKRSAKQASAVIAKYRDPKSGAPWSGRGRAPAWMANAKDRTKFLIEDQA